MEVTAERLIETLDAAKDENTLSSMRREQVVHLPAQGEVIMTGDLHDNRTNWAKLMHVSQLGDNPQRHLILHELIHGEHFDAAGAEDSWRTLFAAADLKCDFPEQVHFLLANHDLAQIFGEGIMKGGASVCEAFRAAIKRDFPQKYHQVEIAVSEFLLSLPLAIRAENGLFCCHSLPTDEQIAEYDFTVFDRSLTGADYKRKTGPVYQLIWGRGVSPEGVTQFAEKVNASFIVTGHQPQDMGFAVNGSHHLIIASDHSQGVYLPLPLSEPLEMPNVISRMRKFAGVALPEPEYDDE